MLNLRRTVLTALAIATITVWGLTNCGAERTNGRSSVPSILASAEDVIVEITSIEACNEEGYWILLAAYETPLRINLLDYTEEGSCIPLAGTQVPAGQYTMVRLFVSSVDIVVEGITYPVDLNNVRRSGVKCKGYFTAADGDSLGLIVDSNCENWFVNSPKGSSNFKLRPVLSMTPVIMTATVSSAVTGRIELLDSKGNPIPVPVGSVIDVYQQGLMLMASGPVTGAVIEGDGSFQISNLEEGTWDMLVILGSGLVHYLPGVEVIGPYTDLGTITIQLPF